MEGARSTRGLKSNPKCIYCIDEQSKWSLARYLVGRQKVEECVVCNWDIPGITRLHIWNALERVAQFWRKCLRRRIKELQTFFVVKVHSDWIESEWRHVRLSWKENLVDDNYYGILSWNNNVIVTGASVAWWFLDTLWEHCLRHILNLFPAQWTTSMSMLCTYISHKYTEQYAQLTNNKWGGDQRQVVHKLRVATRTHIIIIATCTSSYSYNWSKLHTFVFCTSESN